MFVSLAVACGDSEPTPDTGNPVTDAGPDADKVQPDAGRDAKILPPDGGATVAQLVAGAVKANCSKKWLAALAGSGAKPADVRKALAHDRTLKLSKWTTGYSYGHPLKIDFMVPELKSYTYDYTLYVPAAYKADPSKPFALWVDPAHPTTPLKDTYTLKSISTRGKDRFIVLGINFMNVLYKKMDKATYDAMGKKGIVFYQDNFSLFDEAIARVKRDFHIDATKVYISGVSAKGAAAWFHGIFAADHYAAIHPVSIIPVDWHQDMYLNLINTGVYVWQGDADTITPLSKVKPMIDKIKGYGLKVFMYTQKGGSHGGALYYNAMPSIISILLKNYTRTLTPARVHKGISELKIKWKAASATGPGEGKPGDKLSVVVDGKTKGPFTLTESTTLPVATYCKWRDISRLWAGEVTVTLP